jgi:cobalt-zinc-cadmium efflux system membrane fusion protein
MEPIIAPDGVQEGATTIQAAPSAPATAQAPAQGSRSMVRNFGWMVLGSLLAAGAFWYVPQLRRAEAPGSAQDTRVPELTPTPPAGSKTAPVPTVSLNTAQHTQVRLTPVMARNFRAEKCATGKIAYNDDLLSPVFAPYAGRVLRVLAKPGDVVKPGTPLLEMYTPELIQAQTDLIGNATATLVKANTALGLARRNEARQHQLYTDKAAALKDWQQAQADLQNAEQDVQAAEATLLAARDKLRTFGKTERAIAQIEQRRAIERVAMVSAPLAGTITARKVGPGQFIRQDNTDPLFTIADLGQMWMIANVYESDIPFISPGQAVEVQVMAYPSRRFHGVIAYIGTAVDPSTHRVEVRTVVDNRERQLKPEMFATFRILTTDDRPYTAVPLYAVIRDGDKASLWVAQPEQQFVRHEVSLGLEQDGFVQVLSGVQAGEQVVAEGALLLENLAGL